jgi:broad specificity phosphatase PhoE
MINTLEHDFSPERKEFGRDVEIVLKFIRHGERDKSGRLTDYGRGITTERAKRSGLRDENFDAVKGVGSNAGARNSSGQGRALETANIYAHEIAGDEQFVTRAEKVLNYETLANKYPFDWTEVYNSYLPEHFDVLSDEEKANAAKKAQTAVVNYLINLDSPEANAVKDESAGSFAYFIDHYMKMAKRLRSESKVLIPAGTHGGVMEFILQKALVRKDEKGNDVVGFQDLDEIGGEFSPSEAYNVDITTDQEGEPGELKVSFDNPLRQHLQGAYLDKAKLAELKDFYAALHKDLAS